MVSKEKDVNGKVKILYDYLKNNVRYVSIQLGIGQFEAQTNGLSLKPAQIRDSRPLNTTSAHIGRDRAALLEYLTHSVPRGWIAYDEGLLGQWADCVTTTTDDEWSKGR